MERRRERIDRGIKVRSEDIFALCSWREMLYLAFPRLLPIVGLILLSFVLSIYWQKVLLSVSVFALLAISWDILAQTGMISLGQALFFGMGAYLAGIMNHTWGLSPFITIPVATVCGGLFCTLLLLPSGLGALPSKWVELYTVILALLAALFGLRRLMGSDFGLVLKGINDNDRSVMSAGINIYWFKAQALFIAGSVGAFAGAYMTHVYMFVGMPVFALDYSILPIAAAVVGGTGTLAGPMLGAFILVPLSEILRGLGGLRIVFYGLFLVVFTVALPEGIFHYIRRKYHQFERWVEVDT
ncbi:MAG: branched-chain amino acid ABC transporter permease [Deltaproteobacteria bacterium]|nr:branched-chain amino acid ABC transporter permease [Deltaproteobacteria bacterium]